MSEIPELLAGLAERLDVMQVLLRCEHANLETVYLSVERGSLVAHDHCDTSQWLVANGGAYGEPWSEARARTECEPFGTELMRDWRDPPDEPPDESMPRIQRIVRDGDDPKDVVGMVAASIDAVFEVHNENRD